MSTEIQESAGKLLLNKWFCALFLVVIDTVGIAIPFLLGKKKSISDTPILSVFNAFGLGAMLALGFIHLLAEASEEFKPTTINMHGTPIEVNFLWFYFVGIILFLISIDKISIIVKECGCMGSNEDEKKGHHHLSLPVSHAKKEIGDKEHGSDDKDGSDSSSSSSSTITKLPKASSMSASILILSISLSIHSLVEGLIVGFAKSTMASWMIALVLSGHKWIEGIVIATELMHCDGLWVKIVPCIAFIIASPMGVIIGAYAHNGADWLGQWVLLISSVSIVYVAFTEVIESTFEHPKWTIWKCLSAVCGAALVAYLTLLEIRAEALYGSEE